MYWEDKPLNDEKEDLEKNIDLSCRTPYKFGHYYNGDNLQEFSDFVYKNYEAGYSRELKKFSFLF